MALPPSFWRTLKRILLVLIAVSLIAAVVCLIAFTEVRRTFFAACSGIIALNLLLIYFFVRINDRKRPEQGNPPTFELHDHRKE